MDLLFKRYASPFLLVDQMLLIGEFNRFISEIYDYAEEEKIWDYFLHKVYGKSFDEFKLSLQQQSQVFDISNKQIETTINESFEIMENFVPDDMQGGDE